MPALYQWSKPALYWRSPYFVNIFVRGGASQKSWNHILPFSQGSRPSDDTTWEEAVRGCTIRGYDFLFYKYHVINHKGNWLGTFSDKFWANKDVIFIKFKIHIMTFSQMLIYVVIMFLFHMPHCTVGYLKKSKWSPILHEAYLMSRWWWYQTSLEIFLSQVL